MQLPANFNGVLFLLKEPHRDENDNSKIENTWPIRLLNDEIIVGTKYERAIVTKFKNRFREMLLYIKMSNNDLRNCTLININPLGGGSVESETYRMMDKGSAATEIIVDVNPMYVFTCIDIYNKLKREYCILSDAESAGIRYENETLKSFHFKNMHIFEIFHPSRSPRVLLPL